MAEFAPEVLDKWKAWKAAQTGAGPLLPPPNRPALRPVAPTVGGISPEALQKWREERERQALRRTAAAAAEHDPKAAAEALRQSEELGVPPSALIDDPTLGPEAERRKKLDPNQIWADAPGVASAFAGDPVGYSTLAIDGPALASTEKGLGALSASHRSFRERLKTEQEGLYARRGAFVRRWDDARRAVSNLKTGWATQTVLAHGRDLGALNEVAVALQAGTPEEEVRTRVVKEYGATSRALRFLNASPEARARIAQKTFQTFSEDLDRAAQRSLEAAGIPQSPVIRAAAQAEGWLETIRTVGVAPIDTLFSLGTESFVYGLPGIAAGFLSGGTGTAMLIAGASSFGMETTVGVLDALEKAGIDPNNREQLTAFALDPAKVNKAFADNTLHGAFVALFDMLSVGVAGKLSPFKAGKGLARGARGLAGRAASGLGNMALEIPAQGFAGGLGEYTGRKAAGYADSPFEVLAEVLGEGFSGFGEVAGAAYREARAARAAKRVSAVLSSLADSAKDTELAAKAPKRYRDALSHILRQAGDATPVESMFVSPEDFTTALEKVGMDPGTVAEELGVSEDFAAGRSVEIPLEDLLAKVAPTPAMDALLPLLRTAPDQPNAQEADAILAETKARLKDAAEQIAAQAKAGEDSPAVRVQKRVEEAAVSAGRSKKEARSIAKVQAAFYETLAQDINAEQGASFGRRLTLNETVGETSVASLVEDLAAGKGGEVADTVRAAIERGDLTLQEAEDTFVNEAIKAAMKRPEKERKATLKATGESIDAFREGLRGVEGPRPEPVTAESLFNQFGAKIQRGEYETQGVQPPSEELSAEDLGAVYDQQALPESGTERKAQVVANAALHTRLVSETARDVPAKITTANDALAALQFFTKKAQENFLALITDENGTPLAIIRHGIGSHKAVMVHPGFIAGSALAVPGAAQVWVAHNHPGGSAVESREDVATTDRLANIFRGSGVKLRGHIVMAEKGATLLSPDGGVAGLKAGAPADSPAEKTVPVQERELEILADPGEKITGPDVAKQVVSEIDAPGVLLLNTQNQVLGFLALSADDMAAMRADHPDGSALARTLRAVHDLNANSAIISYPAGIPDNIVHNVGNALKAAGVTVLDAVSSDGYSFNEAGRDVANGSVFYQRGLPAIDPATLPKSTLGKMNRTLKSMGYDVRGSDDVRRLLPRMLNADGRFWHPDWAAAYEKATSSEKDAEARALAKAEATHVDWGRVRAFGTTTSLAEAGYIRPTGTLIDLSGKREGGTPGARAHDHREVGGYAGMQELMALGYIRIDGNSGMVDIAKKLTARQRTALRRLAGLHRGALVIEATDGLGPWRDDHYESASRRFYEEYPVGTPVSRILADIDKFYAGGQPARVSVVQQFRQGVRGQYDSATGVITLFKTANKTTLLHESAHSFLAAYQKILESGQAPKTLVDRMATLDTWFEKQGAKTEKEKQEKFARAFEAYLMEGRAPSVALARVFEQFAAWLVHIYRQVLSLEQAENFKMDAEIRQFFDRMLATEEQVKAAEEYHATYAGLKSAFEDALDLTEAERERLRKRKETAKRRAVQGRRSRLLKAYLKALGGKKEFVQQARAEVAKSPIYQLMDALADGEGLSAAQLDEIVGEKTRKALAKKRVGVVSKEGGRSPAMAADEFGFDNVADMVDTVLGAPTKTEAIKQGVEARIEQAEREILEFAADPDAVIAEEDYHNEERLRVLTETLSILASKGQPKALKDAQARARALRATARAALAKLPLPKAIRYSSFSAEEVRARKKALAAQKKGDTEAMVRWLEAEALAHAMVLESVKARDGVAKIKRKLKKAGKAKIHDAWQQQLFAVLTRAGVPTISQVGDDAPSLAEFMASLLGPEPDELSPAVPAWSSWVTSGQPIDLKTATLEQVQELGDLVEWLRGRGKDELDGRLYTYDAMLDDKVAEVVTPIKGRKSKRIIDGDKHPVLKALSDRVRKYLAEHEMLGFLMDAADGYLIAKGPEGATFRGPNREMHDRLSTAQGEYDQLTKRLLADLREPLAVLKAYLREHGAKALDTGVEVPEVLRNEGRGWTAERIIAVALNTGNHENIVRLLDGYGLADTKTLEPGTVPDVLWKLTASLGDAEWQAIQGVWDTIESLYPALSGVFKRMNHFRMAKVEAQELTLPSGEKLRGGYYPAKYDPVLNKRAGQWSEKDDLLNRTETIFQTPAAKSGFTKARTGGAGRPLKLDLSVLLTHLDDTARYITHAEVVRDIDRITQHKDYEAAFKRAFGRQAYDMIRPALKWVARPQGEIGGTLDKWADRSRVKATAYILALNFSVAAKQIFSLPGAVLDIGPRAYFQGVNRLLKNPHESLRIMRELSPYMETRSKSFDRELADALKDFTASPKELAGWKMSDVRDATFALIKTMDFLTVTPVWNGAYYTHMKRSGGNIAESVQYADGVIRNSQPSAKPLDLGHFQRSKLGFHRMLSFFMTFTAKYGNRQRHFLRALRDGAISRRQYLTHLMVEAVAPPVLMNLMFAALWGNLGEDWDEPEDKFAELLGDVILYQTSGYLLVRDLAAASLAIVDKRRYPTNPWDSPVWMGTKLGFDVVKQLSEGDGEGLALALAEVLSLEAQVPAPRLARRMLRGLRQYEEGAGTPVNILIPEPRRR